jgi:hypothetical protein
MEQFHRLRIAQVRQQGHASDRLLGEFIYGRCCDLCGECEERTSLDAGWFGSGF